MKHRWTHRLTVGFLGMATIFIAMWGCGRERVNPIDSNFEGNTALNPPGDIRIQGGIGRIALNWNPVNSANLAGYGVYRATSATGNFARLSGESSAAEVTTARTTFVDSTLDLSASKIYFYKLKTVDTEGQTSEFSAYVSAEALDDTRAPGAPTNFVAVTDVNNAQVTLGWSAPEMDEGNEELTGLSGYKIFRIKDSQGRLQVQGQQEALVALISELGIDLDNLGDVSEELANIFVQFGPVPSGQTFFVDTDKLEAGVLYVYLVTAVDPAGNTGRAAIALVTVQTPGANLPMPANLSATQNQQARIVVSWNPVADPNLLGYLVLRSQSTQGPFTPVTGDTLFTTGQTQYVDSLVVADEVYFYKVQTVVQDPQFGVLRSDTSTFIDGRAIADESAPGAPSDLIVSLDEDHFQRVTLSWTAPTQDSNKGDLTGLASFEIFRSRDNNTSFVSLATVSGDKESYVDTSVDLLAKYFYAVRAVDASGNAGPRSAAVSVTTKGFAVPSKVSAVGGVRKITLSWDANTEPELTGYEILRFAEPGDATPQRTFKSVLTTYVDTPVVAGQLFVYRVRAVGPSSDVKSELSAFVSAQAEAPALAAPSKVSAVGGIGQIAISWNANTEIELTGYRVLRYTDPAETMPDKTIETLQTTYVDSPLAAGQEFVYRVQALGANDEESALSQYVAARVLVDESPPGAPSDLIVSLDEDHFQRVTLSWTAPTQDSNKGDLTGLASFEIYRSRDNNTSFALLETVSSDQVRYVDTSVDLLAKYFYAVRAVDASGNAGPRSAPVSVTTKGFAVPSKVIAVGGVRKITLSWDANTEPELTGYEILRFADPGDATPQRVFNSVLTTYVDTPVVAGQPFVYRVRAVGPSGVTSELSAFVSAQAEAPVLAVPSKVSAVGGIGQIAISWNANTESELTGYRVLRYTDSAETMPDDTFVTVQTTYVDSPLAAGETFVYRVQALGANDAESALSPIVAAEVLVDDVPPATPGNFTAIPSGGTAIELRWNAPKTDANGNALTGLSGYRIYRTSGASPTELGREEASERATYFLVLVDASERRYFDRDVEGNTAYVYQIAAIDGNGNESPRSARVTARTEVGVVPARDLRADYNSDTQTVTLSWGAPALFDSFIIERAVLPAGGASSQNLSYQTLASEHSTASYVDSGVARRTIYVYRVSVNLNGRISDPTEAVYVSIP